MVLIKQKKRAPSGEEQKEQELQKAGLQDQFQAKGIELVTHFETHRKVISGVIVAVLSVGVVFFGYRTFNQRSEGRAMASLENALAIKLDEKMPEKEDEANRKILTEKAKAAFAEVAEKYAQAKPGHLARMFEASIWVSEGELDKAAKAYRDAAAGSASTKLSVALASMALGRIELMQKKSGEALAAFKKADDAFSSLLGDEDLWHVILLAEEMKQGEDARRYANQFIQRFPNSEHIEEVKSRFLKPEEKAKS
jgi:predicted negative regulator of RcsB-dependent stress response